MSRKGKALLELWLDLESFKKIKVRRGGKLYLESLGLMGFPVSLSSLLFSDSVSQ